MNIGRGFVGRVVRRVARTVFPEPVAAVFNELSNEDRRGALRLEMIGHRFTPQLADFPPMVMCDTTTRCNLPCVHCPNSVLAGTAGFIGEMPTDLYRRIVDEIAEESPTTLFRPFDKGEPLMRKDKEELVAYAKERGLTRVGLTTNGLLMTRSRARSFIEAGLDRIEFSIDAATPATYQRIRMSPLFDRLVANIEQFIALRNRLRPKLHITVSFVTQPANLVEADRFANFWRDRVDEVSFREMHQHGGHLASVDTNPDDAQASRHPCPYLWNRLVIHHDGIVSFCEFDWKREHTIGDVRTANIREIWRSAAYRMLRKEHVDGNFAHPFCAGCHDWPTVRW